MRWRSDDFEQSKPIMHKLHFKSLLIAIAALVTAGTSAQQLLPPDQAFRVKVSAASRTQLTLELAPAPGYYLYRDKTQISATPVKVTALRLPKGEIKEDKTFGKVDVFFKPVTASADLAPAPTAKKLAVTVKYQGCNDPVGVCYPPEEKVFDIALP